jgi:hypothetical protein
MRTDALATRVILFTDDRALVLGSKSRRKHGLSVRFPEARPASMHLAHRSSLKSSFGSPNLCVLLLAP